MTVVDKTTAVSLSAIAVTEIFITKYADKSINKSADFTSLISYYLETL